MVESEPNYYKVIVAGAGVVLQEKFTPEVLDRLGPPKTRIIFDLTQQRVLDEETRKRSNNLLVADGQKAPFKIPEDRREEYVCAVTTPEHLRVIRSLIETGVKKFIVEKPLVNNSTEANKLEELLRENPDLRLYPLDFYVQKAAPLLILTGAIKSEDPRFSWVVMGGDDSEVNGELCGSLENHIGKIEGIEVTVFEGGNLGTPDIAKRRWLVEDKTRGGMLLDLGTHALAPLFASKVLSADEIKVESAFREVFGKDGMSFIKAKRGQPETCAGALLTVRIKDREIPLILTVGKTFQDGGVWKLIIRGEKGDISFGLRTGQRLTVEPKEGQSFQLKLRKQDPYGMAFQEAKMYFGNYPGFDGNLGAMLDSIRLIDEIKRVSNK